VREKSGGRIKGTPNKSVILMQQKAEELKIDPFTILLLFAAGDWKSLGYASEKYISGINEYGSWEKWTIDPSVRCKAVMEACQFLLPKRKAIDQKEEELDVTPIDEMDTEDLKRLEASASKGLEELKQKIKQREPT
jgi:hypothetical protein